MKILERNYQGSLQAYLVHGNEDEAKSILRNNLLSRLAIITKDLLNAEEKETYLTPNVKVRVIKVRDKETGKCIFMGGLTHPGMKFERTEEPLGEPINEAFKNSGVDLPTSDFLDEKLDKTFSITTSSSDPFKLVNLEISEYPSESVCKEFSLLDIEDKEFSEKDDFQVLKSVCLLAMHKHVVDNPNSEKARLLLGVENLSKQIVNEQDKEEVRVYLLQYINEPHLRPMLVRESELIIKTKSDGPNSIKLWKIAAVVGVILAGALIYNQRNRIKDAWGFSKIASKSTKNDPREGRMKSFFKTLFTPSGRSISKSYMNSHRVNKESTNFLSTWDLKRRESELNRDKSEFNMKGMMNKYYKK